MTVAAEIPAPGLAMVDAAVEDEGSSRAAQQQEKLVALRAALSGAEGRDAAEKLVQGKDMPFEHTLDATCQPMLARPAASSSPCLSQLCTHTRAPLSAQLFSRLPSFSLVKSPCCAPTVSSRLPLPTHFCSIFTHRRRAQGGQ